MSCDNHFAAWQRLAEAYRTALDQQSTIATPKLEDPQLAELVNRGIDWRGRLLTLNLTIGGDATLSQPAVAELATLVAEGCELVAETNTRLAALGLRTVEVGSEAPRRGRPLLWLVLAAVLGGGLFYLGRRSTTRERAPELAAHSTPTTT